LGEKEEEMVPGEIYQPNRPGWKHLDSLDKLKNHGALSSRRKSRRTIREKSPRRHIVSLFRS
jgi:hypothetical protein